jgi:hypothetical protein
MITIDAILASSPSDYKKTLGSRFDPACLSEVEGLSTNGH